MCISFIVAALALFGLQCDGKVRFDTCNGSVKIDGSVKISLQESRVLTYLIQIEFDGLCP